MGKTRQMAFWLLMLALPVVLAALVLPPAWQRVRTAVEPAVVAYVATHLSPAEKQAMQQQLRNDTGGMFEEIPDPLAARVGKAGFQGDYKGAPVQINAAGMRDTRAFAPPLPGTFRIVCLGDSFVFGTGVPQQQRFCDRLQAYYQDKGITVAGKRIETLAVGLPSYTARQEAAYLAARLDEYAPDVIILVTVHNDMTDNAGVTSAGALTSEFSIEQRAAGSAVNSNQAAVLFGESFYTALTTDLSPLARQQWDKAFAAISELDRRQTARGGKMLLSVLQMPARHSRYFYEIYKQRARAAGLHYVMVDYWQGKKTRLPDDGHPNAYGHELIMAQYVHTLAGLGWVPVPANQLPVPDVFVADPLDPLPDMALYAQEKQQFVREHLAARLDFAALPADGYGAVLGGLFPETAGEKSVPWASVRAAFLLQAPAGGRGTVHLQVGLPERRSVFPFTLSATVNGVPAGQQAWQWPAQGSTVALRVPYTADDSGIVEVLLETPQYFSGLQDQRMKSYRLLSAALE